MFPCICLHCYDFEYVDNMRLRFWKNETLGVFGECVKLGLDFLKFLNFKEECHYILNYVNEYKSFAKLKELINLTWMEQIIESGEIK